MQQEYHHGNLRRTVLDAAADVIGREGPSRLSLRSLAEELGVSHTAPRHHFGSREGVLNALAVEGFTELEARLAAADGLLELGVGYVEFAVSHPGHFAVMFSPDLLDLSAPDLAAARSATFARLQAEASAVTGQTLDSTAAATATTAAWSLVHGLAVLLLSGSLDAAGLRTAIAAGDLADLTRRVAGLLFSGRPPAPSRSTPSSGELG